jgi:hypothetical protein
LTRTIGVDDTPIVAPMVLEDVDDVMMVVGAKAGGSATYEFEVTEAGASHDGASGERTPTQ